MKELLLLTLGLILFTAPSVADEAKTSQCNSNGLVKLADGSETKLAAIRLANQGALSEQALQICTDFVRNKMPVLEAITADRYGRQNAEIYSADKKAWLQEILVQQGLAYVYPLADQNMEIIKTLLKAESAARTAQRGLWLEPDFTDLPPDQADSHIGHYIFVVGTVSDVQHRRSQYYLTFNKAETPDNFRALLSEHAIASLKENDQEPKDFQGKKIRLRGLVEMSRGSLMVITNAAQIEILPEAR